MDLGTQVRIAVKYLTNELSQCQGSEGSEQLAYVLEAILTLSKSTENDERVEELFHHNAFTCLGALNVSQVKICFQTTHFLRLLNLIICEGYCHEWISGPLGSKIAELLNRICENGPPAYVFLALSSSITKCRHECSRLFCRRMLRQFLQSERLGELLWEQCHVPTAATKTGGARVPSTTVSMLWEELVSGFCSLPDRVANVFQSQNQDFFLPASYIPLLGRRMLQTLQKIHDSMQKSTDCSVEFISRMFSKLCLKGGAGMLWDTWLPTLWRVVEKDYVWRRILERLLTSLSPGSVELVVVPLIRKLPWYGLVEWFLGDSVNSNSQIQTLLATKLIFHRCFDDNLTLQNTIGYLASSPSRKKRFEEVLMWTLEVWSDASALKHNSYPQQLYITKALIICFSHFSPAQHTLRQEEVLKLLMQGVSVHLSSSSNSVRRLGMVVGEVVTSAMAFSKSSTEPLKFEYELDDEVTNLKSLLTVPERPGVQELEKTLGAMTVEERPRPEGETAAKAGPLPQPHPPVSSDSDLDSDDDLEPYDMSNDTKAVQVEPPKFIRDCMEGLLCSEQPARVEVCLKAAPTLIQTSIDDVDEIAEEMCKILLHLSEDGSMEGFRFTAMVTLAVRSPGPVADYLCREFYAVNYNLRQRMDMLEVLSAAATELAKPQDPKSKGKTTSEQPQRLMEVLPDSAGKEDWRKEVERRIASKTRRFASASRPPPAGVANRFAPVAGRFFFPLIRFFDRKENTFDLLGQDTLVLVRLIVTLAHIAQAAVGAPVAGRMGQSLLEFIWTLRLHSDHTVRSALLYAACSLAILVPPHLFLSDLNSSFMELTHWLQDTTAKDPDQTCQALAANAWQMLQRAVTEEMKSLVQSA